MTAFANPYAPHTESDVREMLDAIGVGIVDDLFAHLPDTARRAAPPAQPALSELELTASLTRLAQRNAHLDARLSFLGAGAYDHFVPSAVWALASRGEFLTAYTPYQAELMQGWLQALFEYQDLIQTLTGMDVANASMYDGATATFEAVKVALNATKRDKVVVSRALHPRYRDVLRTLLAPIGVQLIEAALEDGHTVPSDLRNAAVLVVQSPNYLGLIEDVAALAEAAHSAGALIVQVVTDPTSLGLLKAPGELSVDLVAAEGQALGNPPAYGGPHLGILAARAELVRLLPGRLVGQGHDARGCPGYVLTLQTREQHVRREKAGSNICTNQSLNALASAIFLALLGPRGLRDVAELSVGATEYARQLLGERPGFEIVHSGPHFHEFALRTPLPPRELNARLHACGVQGGMPLDADYPELGHAVLLCFTERHDQADVERLADLLCEVTA